MESAESTCCDPYSRHRKPISKSLREIIPADVKKNPKLVAGLYWCDNCRKSCQDGETSGADAGLGAGAGDDKSEGSSLQGLELSSIQDQRSLRSGSVITEETKEQSIFCCDPYLKHKKKISKGLRKITASDLERNPDLEVGLYLCDNCRKIVHSVDDQSEPKEKCCNPFKIHFKPNFEDLKVITEDDKQRHPNLTVGFLWCVNCRNVSPAQNQEEAGCKSEENSQEIGAPSSSQSSGGTTASPSISPSVQIEAANRALEKIGLSPLVTSALRSKEKKVSTVKRKVEEVTTVIEKKVCLALGLSEEDVKNIEAKKAQDYDILMDEVKKKLPAASKTLKYQLLSLAPASMSVREGAQFFNVSRNLFVKARKLKEEQGILPTPHFSRASTVLESTKSLIVDYYCNEENSKVMPGLRDCVSIRKGVYEQKRLLLSNLPELYQAFKRDHEDIKVGFSTFCSLKPKWCITASSAGTHVQCVCQMHQNFKLVLYALNIDTHYRDLIRLCVCNPEDRACMLRICEQCPTLDRIVEILKQQITLTVLPESDPFSSDDENDYFEEIVKFRQWKSTDGTEMVAQVCSRSELIDIASKQLSELITHDFISCSQRDYVKKLKEELLRNKVVIAQDFSMNYNCIIQGAVQSYHWSPTQVTVHPTVVYFKDDMNELQHTSIIFISDDLEHDVPLVRKFQERTIEYIKEKIPGIEEIEYVSDGCAAQYKSKGYFKNLCGQEAEFGVKVCHSYFATSHGKSQCDADGGSVKRTARNASLQRPLDKQIISAQDLFNFCLEQMGNKFVFQFVSKSEVQDQRKFYKEIMPDLETLPGTKTFHFIKPLSEGSIACWRVSKDQTEPPSLIHSLLKTTRGPTEALSILNGMYVVVRLNKERYVAMVTDWYEEEAEADVSLLMPKLPVTKELHWPRQTKTATVPLPHILCELALCEQEGKICLTENDLQNLYRLRIMRRH